MAKNLVVEEGILTGAGGIRKVWASRLSVLTAAALLVLGCSSDGRFGETSAKPPGRGSDLTAPPDPNQPYGGSARLEAAPKSATGDPSKPPGKSDLAKASATSDRRQADSEACYRFALAQVRNDMRIDDDISFARNQAFSQNSRLTVHTQRIDSYYYENERVARFDDCMRSKGYDLE